MIHLLFLVLFSAAVGTILGAMLRDDPREIAVLAGWITGGMTAVALVVAWILYLLPVGS